VGITSKDLKKKHVNVNKLTKINESVKIDLSKDEIPENEKKETVQEIKVTAKKWSIDLIEASSYKHPKIRKKFVKGVALLTSDKELADDLATNSYFSVTEI
jgi:exonuclease III